MKRTCEQCGAPRKDPESATCAYCGSFLPGPWTQKRPVDHPCPFCGKEMESSSLMGDDVVVLHHYYCLYCGGGKTVPITRGLSPNRNVTYRDGFDLKEIREPRQPYGKEPHEQPRHDQPTRCSSLRESTEDGQQRDNADRRTDGAAAGFRRRLAQCFWDRHG